MWFEERERASFRKRRKRGEPPSLSFLQPKLTSSSTTRFLNRISSFPGWMDEQELYERLKVSINHIKLSSKRARERDQG